MEAFARELTETFELSLESALRTHCPNLKDSPSEELRQFVREARKAGEFYGIFVTGDIFKWVLHAGKFGRNFGTAQGPRWAHEIVGNPHLSGAEKVEAIDSYLKNHRG